MGPSQLTLSSQYEIESKRGSNFSLLKSLMKPDAVHVSKGIQSSAELVVQLFFKSIGHVYTYSCQLDSRANSLDFKQSPNIIENVGAIASF